MAVLTVVEGREKGRSYFLHDEDLSAVELGRDPTLRVSLEDQSASRHHARIDFSGDRFKFVDLGSSNGTFVNEERITERVLADGDVVRVGRTKLRFDLNGPGDVPHQQSTHVEPTDEPRPIESVGIERSELGESRVDVHDKEDFLELAVDLDSLEFERQDKDQAALVDNERKKLKTIYRVSEAIGTQLNQDKLMEDIMPWKRRYRCRPRFSISTIRSWRRDKIRSGWVSASIRASSLRETSVHKSKWNTRS